MSFRHQLRIGDRIQWDGERHTVVAFLDGAVELRSDRQRHALVELSTLASSMDFRVLTAPVATDDVVTFLDNAPPEQLKMAQERLAHLNEAVTGFREGIRALAVEGEPKIEYDPDVTTLTERIKSKAKEIGVSERTLWTYRSNYAERGLAGLLDERTVPIRPEFPRVDSRIKDALRAEIDEINQGTTISIKHLRRLVERRLNREYPDETITMVSRITFTKMVAVYSRGKGTFGASKTRRGIDSRPKSTYRRFRANRPGEVVVIDTSPLDAFALDSYSLDWVSVQLTVAYDLHTRSLIAWRFTPRSTKGVDVVMLLYDLLRPKVMRRGWPDSARWPYVGVPESVVLELVEDIKDPDVDRALGVAGIPVVRPDSLVVDRGRVYLSQAFKDACERLGISIQLARPRRPTDKSHIESVFNAIREDFVQGLPGYKGPDLHSRGAQSMVEDKAFYFIDEIESLFAEWVATYWQKRPHAGLDFPELPRLPLSPNDMYEQGLAKSGFPYIVPDSRMYFELLPTEWRVIDDRGVQVYNLLFDGDILEEFRNRKSEYGGIHPGHWPIRVDKRDLSQVYFFDPEFKQWHSLPWVGLQYAERPFDDATLGYAKSLVVARGGTPRDHTDLNATLNELLDRMDAHATENRSERRLAAKRAIQAKIAESDRPDRPQDPSVGPDEEITFGSHNLIGERGISLDFEGREVEVPEDAVRRILRTADDPENEDDFDF